MLWVLMLGAMLSCQREMGSSLLTHVHPLTGSAPSLRGSSVGRPGLYGDAGQTVPAVTAPFGMTQFTPQTRSGEKPGIAPYYFLDGMTQGIRVSHWTSGTNLSDYGSFTLSPVSGQFTLSPHARKAAFFFDNDHHSPAYCAMHIPLFDLITEVTATRRCGFLRISWLNPNDAMIVIDVNNDRGEGYLEIFPEKNEIVASNPVEGIFPGEGVSAGFSGHMVLRFDNGFESYGTCTGSDYHRGECLIRDQPGMGGFVKLKLDASQLSRIRVGTSFTSVEEARANLEAEIPDWDFDSARKALETTWEQLLARAEVTGGTPEQRNIFYTALAHSCLHPRLFSDVSGTCPGFGGDTTLQRAEGFDYYTDFAAWDTYRAQMPLLSLIAPREYRDMVTSLVTAASQWGWLPSASLRNGPQPAATGDYVAAIIGDALMKGFDIDREKAWSLLRRNCFETPGQPEAYARGMGRPSLGSYQQLGYIPLEEIVSFPFRREEQVSRSLEYAYGDWVAAQVARLVGENADEEALRLRAENHTLLFDPEKGWICGKFADGTFTSDFAPDGYVPWLTESTPRQATFSVVHDLPGMVERMGGAEEFRRRLEAFFSDGGYWHGHGPNYHVPYLFNAAGDWAATQHTITRLMAAEYSDDPAGLGGQDDAGQFSAWYVFSAMGFYPVCPGSNTYFAGAPLFPKITLHTGENGKERPLVIETQTKQPGKPFASLRLNGKTITPVLNHDQIRKGGKLLFLQ